MVFVDGCFWHGCPDHYTRPRSRSEYWAAKLERNVARDQRQTMNLEAAGWRVVRIWEHRLWMDLEGAVQEVCGALSADSWVPAPDWRVIKVLLTGDTPDVEARHMRRLRDPDAVRVDVGERFSGAGRPRK